MFSPSRAEGGPATATRSRRRQRPRNSEDAAQQPKAKRQRLPLTEQTFVNPEEAPEPVQEAAPPPKNEKPVRSENKPKTVENIENINPTPRRETTNGLRVKKPKHGDRAANKGDGSVLLVRIFSSLNAPEMAAAAPRVEKDQ
jgi:nuclear pore complex protein Nup133